MKLISHTRLMPWEEDFVYSTDEALSLLKRSYGASLSTTGLSKLRRTLTVNSDAEVSSKLRRRQWLLIKDDAYYFNWKTFDKASREQHLAQAVTQLMANPPAQVTKKPFEFMVIDSVTIEPLSQRKCEFCHDDTSVERKTDKEGLTYLSLESAPVNIAVRWKR